MDKKAGAKRDWESDLHKVLDEWMDSRQHTNHCAAWSEMQCCCLDKQDHIDEFRRCEVRPVIIRFIKKLLDEDNGVVRVPEAGESVPNTVIGE